MKPATGLTQAFRRLVKSPTTWSFGGRAIGCAGFALLVFCGFARGQNPAPGPEDSTPNYGGYAKADIAYGAQLYTAQCSGCHGVNGDAQPGINFRAGQFKRVASDNDLRMVITNGISGTAMPAWHFNNAELTSVVAYLRNMSKFNASNVVPGDAAHGKALYDSVGQCATCHRINGAGPFTGPDLTNVGAARSPDFLERTLLDADGAMLPNNRSIRAVTKANQTITGRRLNEDTYTVQLIDSNNRLVSLNKSDLREYTVLKASGMPSYKDKLSSKDVSDLVAYLLSLKGGQ
jgi:putative heme-binding domain-containing protein